MRWLTVEARNLSGVNHVVGLVEATRGTLRIERVRPAVDVRRGVLL